MIGWLRRWWVDYREGRRLIREASEREFVEPQDALVAEEVI